MKLRLIPILSDMHHNISTATQVGGAQYVGGTLVSWDRSDSAALLLCQVRELCLQLLPSYPSFSLVTSTLHTLTSLAKATRVHIPDQVTSDLSLLSSTAHLPPPPPPQVCLLLSYAASDARRKVRLFAVRELLQLAEQAPHMWSRDMTQVRVGESGSVSE